MNFLVFTTFICAHHMITGSGAIQINISPDKCIAAMEDEVHISCLGDTFNHEKEVTLMKLYRNDEDPIAILRKCSNITYGEDSTNFQASGSISKDGRQSFLNVTLSNPKSSDTGIYTCVVYVDQIGVLKEEKASTQLTVERLDVKSLETVLNELKTNQNHLFSYKENKENELKQQVNGLRAKVDIQSNEILELTKKEPVAASAFHVTCKERNIKLRPGHTLILPDVLMRHGGEYDEETGIFTASRKGLYAFHLAARSSHGCGMDMDLMVNDTPMAKLRAYVKDQWDQSSISTVLELQPRDMVYAKITVGDCSLHNMYTFFSGMLIQAV